MTALEGVRYVRWVEKSHLIMGPRQPLAGLHKQAVRLGVFYLVNSLNGDGSASETCTS
jgi:hypothetical protein